MTFIRPAITPKLGGTIATLMDITGYYTLDVKPDGSEVRELRVKPTKVIEAKTRNWFPKPVLIDPVFKDLLPPKKKEEAA